MGAVTSDFYHRDAVFAAEMDRVFRPSWLCVGFAEDLKNPNDFITTDIGPHGIVVQNFKGELRAFRNVCTHRFSRLQTEPCGNRPLTCPYHGWTFGKDGAPVGIPFERQSFGFSAEEKVSLSLDTYAVEVVGNFVFVRMEPGDVTLRDYLDTYYDMLAHLGGLCTDRVESERFVWEGNWKLAMDNAAEAYHVPLVHADNFSLILHNDLSITTEGEHATSTGELKERSVKWWANACRALKIERSDQWQGYMSAVIFPNIVLTFSYGAFLTFQTFDPIDKDCFTIKTAAWIGTNRGGAARAMIHENLREFTASVRADDEHIIAQVHKGTRDLPTPRRAVLGAMEAGPAQLQRAYAERMKGVLA
ncbi:SRPBCC family protein [Asticcacaulis sp. BYS171W]|uniref:SRPBCC family protein n=1 Tax=Asticcacaulis aquaticus TaxID=2984212 RepID=A0ABT5HRY8_9CAUL|nr:SRPBCC family protein [Asticcacaulis aquaticus]MDC7682749.1 SRPBCC family protein [Asticcacaulis aquaticus]